MSSIAARPPRSACHMFTKLSNPIIMRALPLSLILATLLSFFAPLSQAQAVAPHAIDIPAWFTETFLDFREDVAEAKADGKRVMIYFGQDGCPYCAKLMRVNFQQPDIVAYTRQHFMPIALNMWGDRETVWLDGRSRPEKDLARELKVQFTPTLLFLNEEGEVIARINGYYHPERFKLALQYAGEKLENQRTLAEHLQQGTAKAAPAAKPLHAQPFFMKPPYDLRRKADSKPLAILVETSPCETCDELHQAGFSDTEVRKLIERVDIARFGLNDPAPIIAPDGRKLSAADWLKEQQIIYTPTILFYDDKAQVLRMEAYVGPFHLASALDYVASGAYRKEPSFQRYLQARADAIRAQGGTVELH